MQALKGCLVLFERIKLICDHLWNWMGPYLVSYLWKHTIQSLELCVLNGDLIKICWNSLTKQLKLTMMNINHSYFQSFDCLFSSGSGWRLNLSAIIQEPKLVKTLKEWIWASCIKHIKIYTFCWWSTLILSLGYFTSNN